VIKRTIKIIFFLILLIIGRYAVADELICKFDSDSLFIDPENLEISYSGLENKIINEFLSLPVKTTYLKTESILSSEDFFVPPHEQIVIGHIEPEKAEAVDRITSAFYLSDTIPMPQISTNDLIQSIEYLNIDGFRYVAVTFFPITIDDSGYLILNKSLWFRGNLSPEITKSDDLINFFSSTIFHNQYRGTTYKIAGSGIPLNSQMIVVTNSVLADAFQEFAQFKNETGITCQIALMDSIEAGYPGLDIQDKLRNYLTDFYNSGGQYVLLGGDDIIIPPRYLYYYNTDSPPSSKKYMMPSDLYYADLTGVWDVDGDGIWGEPTDDSPDFVPELIIGRLPVNDSSSTADYTDKLINYCTNPGNGEFDYLTKSFFFSADEMRDYPTGGQHRVIAEKLPDNFAVDTSNVEYPYGNHPAPSFPDGIDGVSNISEGNGLVNIIAHGRVDGFVVRSANYGDWPASLIITGTQVGTHGSTANLVKNNKTSMYYSLSCYVGGYDLDSIDGESTDWSLVERLISAEASGAVGMVAYSRWGWVYSSYFLQMSFTEHLLGDADGNPALAMYYSWLDYPYYRDLIYGQNYFGDPSLRIYSDTPDQFAINLEESKGSVIKIESNSDAIESALVTISRDGQIVESGKTDFDGNYIIETALDCDKEYTITGVKQGYTVNRISYSPSLTLDSEDDEESTLPADFELKQNYPNPFNPSTVIEYSLPAISNVKFTVFNILGQIVHEEEYSNIQPGIHEIKWNASENNGSIISSGVYFYRVRAGNYSATRKMILIR